MDKEEVERTIVIYCVLLVVVEPPALVDKRKVAKLCLDLLSLSLRKVRYSSLLLVLRVLLEKLLSGLTLSRLVGHSMNPLVEQVELCVLDYSLPHKLLLARVLFRRPLLDHLEKAVEQVHVVIGLLVEEVGDGTRSKLVE